MHKAQPGAQMAHKRQASWDSSLGAVDRTLPGAVHLRPPSRISALLLSVHRGRSGHMGPHAATHGRGAGIVWGRALCVNTDFIDPKVTGVLLTSC